MMIWSCDIADQLTYDERTGSNPLVTSFTYDGAGNRLTQVSDGVVTTYTHDASNTVISAINGTDTTLFSYDENGNRILTDANGVLTTYTWDEENRMAGADDGTNTDSFTYAGNGQRRKKSTSTGDIYYLWDEENILEELKSDSSLLAHYTDFPGYWGGLVSLAQPNSTPAPPTAGMGTFNSVQFNTQMFNQTSTRFLVDDAADISDSSLYRAYGSKVLSEGTTRNPHGFQGQAGSMEDALDRVWMRGRIYDPLSGTWMSRDPLGFAGGDWNLYRFVSNNPANMIDPSGLSCSCCNFFFAFAWCCDESCFTSPPIFLPKRSSYPGFGPWNNAGPGGGGASQQWPLCSQSFDSNQDEPGGAGAWIDKWLLFNSVKNAGDAWGRWDAGQASGWEVAGKSVWAAGNIILLGGSIYGLGKAAITPDYSQYF